MNSSRALFHLCASPSAPMEDNSGSGCSESSSKEPSKSVVGKNLFSPFSPMDSQALENKPSNTATPRRKLSLEMDENAQSPQSFAVDGGYGGSLGSSSAVSMGEGSGTGSPDPSSRTPLGDIRLSALNAPSGQRKTLLARRLMKRRSGENGSKENVSAKDSGVEPFKFSQPSPLLHHRPTSLPTLPPSPLTQASPSSGETGPLTRSMQTGASKNLIKQLSSPLERMSLMSPCSSIRGSFFAQRSSSVCSSARAESISDGYFSEVFEGEEMDDINSTPLSDTLTTLINAPFANTPISSTISSKPKSDAADSKEARVGPSSPLFAPPHTFGFFRSDSWCSPLSCTSSFGEKCSQHKRGSLKRASPCNEISQMHRTKRRPPLPFTDFSSNSQDSPPTTSAKPLKGTPLLRSQSCCMPPNGPLHSPSSPGGDDFNKIGDLSKPYALPLVPGSVPDLKCISPETVSNLLSGHYNGIVTNFTIIDCRFPYEFEGGHIANALNIWKKDHLLKHFFENPQHPSEQRNIFVFHCEFSSKRGPQMSRFLRETDRRKNGMDFPKLYYPELYLLEGGYRAFYREYQDLCEPRGYREMVDENHRDELRHCKLRSKSWNGDCHPRRRQPLLRHRKSVFITNEIDTSSSPLSESTFARMNSTPSQLGGHK